MFNVCFVIIFVLAVASVVFNIIGNILCLKSGKAPKGGYHSGHNDFHDTAHRMAMDAHRQATEQAMRDHHTAHSVAMHNFNSDVMHHNDIHDACHMHNIDMGMMNMGGMGMM